MASSNLTSQSHEAAMVVFSRFRLASNHSVMRGQRRKVQSAGNTLHHPVKAMTHCRRLCLKRMVCSSLLVALLPLRRLCLSLSMRWRWQHVLSVPLVQHHFQSFLSFSDLLSSNTRSNLFIRGARHNGCHPVSIVAAAAPRFVHSSEVCPC